MVGKKEPCCVIMTRRSKALLSLCVNKFFSFACWWSRGAVQWLERHLTPRLCQGAERAVVCRGTLLVILQTCGQLLAASSNSFMLLMQESTPPWVLACSEPHRWTHLHPCRSPAGGSTARCTGQRRRLHTWRRKTPCGGLLRTGRCHRRCCHCCRCQRPRQTDGPTGSTGTATAAAATRPQRSL